MLSKPGFFNGASLRDASLPQANYIQPNLGHGLRIWWAYYWPTFLISLGIMGVLMVLLRKTWENVMVSGYLVIWTNRILPYVVVLAVSLLIEGAVGVFVIYSEILDEEFGDFRVTLMPRVAALNAAPAVQLRRIPCRSDASVDQATS